MPPAPEQTTPPGIEIDLSGLIDALGWQGCVVLVALALILVATSARGRRAVCAMARRLVRVIRIRLWGLRLGIGYRLASRLQPERWDGMVAARKLPGLVRGKVRRTPIGIAVHLRLGGSLTLEDVTRNTGQLEAGLGLHRGTARVKPVKRADKALLHIVLRDPLAEPTVWTHPTRFVRLRDAVRLAIDPFGEVVDLDIRQRLGIFGTSGSGKSCVQRLIGAHVIQALDAELEIWDLKFGTESQHYEGKAHRVTTVEDAAARVDWLLDVEFPRRAAVMAARGTSSWKESSDDPALVLMVDEGNVLIREFKDEQLKRFFRVAEQGRALGVYIIWATQYPKATNLPTELRSQLNVRICLKLNSSEESAMVFKDEKNEGWEPHKLKGVGWLLIKSDAHREPNEARAIWLSEERFRDIQHVAAMPLLVVERPIPPRPPFAPTVHLPAQQTPVVELTKPTPAPAPGPSRKRIDVTPSVADDIRLALAVSSEPRGVREIARITGRNPGTISKAIEKLVASGEIHANEDKKYTLITTTADQADRKKGTEA